MKTIDLHVHSNCSDGTFTPRELVDYARRKGLAAFALTDHDTIDGLEEAIAYAESLRSQALAASGHTVDPVSGTDCLCNPDAPVPQVIPGIEFSTEYLNKDVHIVGLFIDYHCPPFLEKLEEFVNGRILRNRKMCTRLQEAGIDITYEKLTEAFPDCVITRAHYARYLLEHGYVRSLNEAFDRYVGDHCPYFVPREKVTPAQAIELILQAGGVPILAHPILYHLSDARLDVLVSECKEAGLVGIEAVYSTYSPSEERQIRRLAAKYDLLISGGSDFHGANKPGLDMGTGYGRLFIPEELLTNLYRKCQSGIIFPIASVTPPHI